MQWFKYEYDTLCKYAPKAINRNHIFVNLLRVRLGLTVLGYPGFVNDHIKSSLNSPRRKNELTFEEAERQRCRSKFKCVYPHGPRKWVAKVKHQGKQINLGIFENETDAHHAVEIFKLKVKKLI